MYAIIRSGGKQYKVKAGDLLRVEKLEKQLGEEFDVTEIIAVSGNGEIVFGEPVVDGAKVTVVVTKQAKAPKVLVFKKKRRQGYRKMQGHRQPYTELFIKAIESTVGAEKADKEAPVYNPEAKKAKAVEEKKETKKVAKKTATKKKVAKKKATTKKKTAKKATTKKKTTTKKATTKKKTTKKKSS